MSLPIQDNDFKYSNSTTSIGHPLGYEEYMMKNFIASITFPTLANLANIYLVLLIAPLWIAVTGPSGGFGRLRSEFKLVKKHVIAAIILWLFATAAMRSLASDGEGQLVASNAGISLALCAAGFFGFLIWARRDRRRNPEVYEGDDGFNSAGDIKRLLRMLIVLGISSAAINWIFLDQ